MNNSWQTAELNQYLKKNQTDPLLDSKNVFLSNPEQKRRIDEMIIHDIFPNVNRALKGTPVQVSFGRDDEITECIEDEWKINTTRALTFLLEDPDRPLVPGSSINWFCRGKIECSAVDYMITFQFYIYFPESFSLNKILKLLKYPAFAGMRPQLDYQESTDGIGVYSIEFERGRGKGGPAVNQFAAGNQIYKDVKDNLEVIYALNDLETDYKSTKLFNRLRLALVEAYEAN